jgi:hypothetical protein
VITFIWGATSMASATIGVFFLRFWRDTHDRLFLTFALAFWVFSLNWLLLALVTVPDESRHLVYLVRLAAFLLIIAGIVDKNRSEPPPR